MESETSISYASMIQSMINSYSSNPFFYSEERVQEGRVYKGIPGSVKPVEILENSKRLMSREEIHSRVMSFLK